MAYKACAFALWKWCSTSKRLLSKKYMTCNGIHGTSTQPNMQCLSSASDLALDLTTGAGANPLVSEHVPVQTQVSYCVLGCSFPFDSQRIYSVGLP